jgi:hypothetical protein
MFAPPPSLEWPQGDDHDDPRLTKIHQLTGAVSIYLSRYHGGSAHAGYILLKVDDCHKSCNGAREQGSYVEYIFSSRCNARARVLVYIYIYIYLYLYLYLIIKEVRFLPKIFVRYEIIRIILLNLQNLLPVIKNGSHKISFLASRPLGPLLGASSDR